MNKKYLIDTEENKKFLEDIREDLLSFGHRFSAPDGSCYYLGNDGSPWKKYNRETYADARMVHVYTLGEFLGHKGSNERVDAAIKGLLGVLKDKEYGGWYSALTPDGGHTDNKLCYVHAFVILAGTGAVLSGHEKGKELLEEALSVYDRYFWNEEDGMSCDTWNTEFTVMDPYRGLNANMHTVEAFLAVADVTKNEKYRIRCGRIIDRVIGWAANNEWRIPEHYTNKWVPDMEYNKNHLDDQFKPYGATPGHGLEWARLIIQWALSTYGDDVDRDVAYIDASENLFNRAVEDGWSADGAPGIVYTTDWNGKPIVHDRMHWVLAEALNTAAVLYQVTRKKKYADYYAQFMAYLDEMVLDHEQGSWFHQMDRNNIPNGTVWPGKPDLYHAIQATLIPYYVPNLSIAVAVKEKKEKNTVSAAGNIENISYLNKKCK